MRIKVCCGNNCGEIAVQKRLSSHFPLEVCSPAITPFVPFQHQSHRKSNNRVYCGGFHSGWLMTLLMEENNQQSWELFIGLSTDVANCGFCAAGHISVRYFSALKILFNVMCLWSAVGLFRCSLLFHTCKFFFFFFPLLVLFPVSLVWSALDGSELIHGVFRLNVKLFSIPSTN